MQETRRRGAFSAGRHVERLSRVASICLKLRELTCLPDFVASPTSSCKHYSLSPHPGGFAGLGDLQRGSAGSLAAMNRLSWRRLAMEPAIASGLADFAAV